MSRDFARVIRVAFQRTSLPSHQTQPALDKDIALVEERSVKMVTEAWKSGHSNRRYACIGAGFPPRDVFFLYIARSEKCSPAPMQNSPRRKTSLEITSPSMSDTPRVRPLPRQNPYADMRA